MDRKALESTAANYPYLQGLWALPMGIMFILAGLSNLEQRPTEVWMLGILGGGLLVCALGCLLIARHYQENYGQVTPTRSRRVRHAVALLAWGATFFVGANRFLFWSSDSPVCVFAAAFAVAMLVYYAILVGLRIHHLGVWGIVLVAGLLPIWGGLDADRDAVAMFPLGLALVVSGLLDQRILARAFRSLKNLDLKDSNVG